MTSPPPRRRGRPRTPLEAIGEELGARLPVNAMSSHPVDQSLEARIMVALARIEERQDALVETNRSAQGAAEARHAHVVQAISAFVPRSEIEKDNRALASRIDDLKARMDTMDKRVWGALISSAGAFGTVILTKVGLMH